MVIEKGFAVDYTIENIRSIKPGKSGEYEGNKYSASVKFKSINIEEVEDEELGLIDKEVILEMKVPCEDKDLKVLNNMFRNLQREKIKFSLSGSLPRQSGKDLYNSTSYENGVELMARLKTLIKK